MGSWEFLTCGAEQDPQEIRPFGLAIPQRIKLPQDVKQPLGRGFTHSESSEVQSLLESVLREEGFPIEPLQVIAFENSARAIGLVRVGLSGRQFLAVIALGSTPEMLPFPASEHVSHGLLLLEERTGQHNDGSPINSEVIVLPDLDADGQLEFLVLSTVSTLFTVDDESKISLVRTFYLGP